MAEPAVTAPCAPRGRSQVASDEHGRDVVDFTISLSLRVEVSASSAAQLFTCRVVSSVSCRERGRNASDLACSMATGKGRVRVSDDQDGGQAVGRNFSSIVPRVCGRTNCVLVGCGMNASSVCVNHAGFSKYKFCGPEAYFVSPVNASLTSKAAPCSWDKTLTLCNFVSLAARLLRSLPLPSPAPPLPDAPPSLAEPVW